MQSLAASTGLATEAVRSQLGAPPKPEMGDYAFPCFQFAKSRKLAPPAAAADLAAKLSSDPGLSTILDKAETAGAFLNIRLKPGVLAQSILTQVREAGATYGDSTEGAGKTIVIDYSSPNIAKPFHVGHLMSTVLGASLVRVYRALGYRVVGVNHLGDWGVQCGFQFLAWQREKEKFAKGQGADPEKLLAEQGLDYLADLYVAINADAKQNPELDKQARALFKKLEDGDAELKALWEKLRRETLQYLQKSYDRLGVKFDTSDEGEGFYEPMLKPLLNDLKTRGIAIESQGALVVPMDDGPPKPGKDPKPPFILLKADEATIYGTRDLAAALYRKEKYNFHRNLYVVDVRQSAHFTMLFKTLAKMGHAWAADCAHVSFGLMRSKDGDTMTTRGGRMIPLSELLDRMVDVVRKIILEKNPELPPEKVSSVAEAVGVGAILFWIQSRRRTSDFVFDWAQATDPSGDTGPYLQYAHARACSILRKSGLKPEAWASADLSLLKEPEETAVARVLEGFPKVLRQAGQDYEPSLISTYLLDVASAFGNFLNKHRVLDSAPGLREARLALVDTVRHVVEKALGIIGLNAPQEM
ncbi:MAG TPA: arginine--tRNA ligase [Planctomycetota bacterium]|nr:arginine--tRNA ligase [Planctomycetota bacterium]